MDGWLDRAEWFVWLTGRILEQHRFAYHFLGGSAEAVEAALFAFACPAGGFGYALEPDLRGPAPEPLSTALALRLLEEVGRCGERDTTALLAHLERTSTPDGGLPARNPQPGNYPAAAAVPPIADPPGSLQSTGPVVGVLRASGVRHPWLDKATEFCWTAIDSVEPTDPYVIEAAVAFLDRAEDRDRARAAANRLGDQVRGRRLAVLDPADADAYPLPAGFPPGLHFYPYDFAHTPDSLAAEWFTGEEMDRSLDHLRSRQLADGGWAMRFPEWAPGTALEWRPILTIEALLTLRAYGRL
ncbi:hypothetical protein ALI144C_36720 [Actinosynnema sp. ALI-1.44]|uniref:hypothetical protein n=1 Tax=Actinosynnema sp. ALI-1.44 TaxID=1933779 RepID=UPI00097CBC4C|nr:hypothetical protein [Actinosynnema sp. ALI-1.44]ONI76216.1 hypothetical protein ALI144C_36720 [Actinosynnema sp. ALI-1.44]